jgi:hypothetical protein
VEQDLREWRSSCKQRKERQENKYGNKEALCFVQYNKFIKGIARADCPMISEYTNLKKLLVVGREKRQNPARQRKVCAAHKKRSETRYICKFCVLLHKGYCFEKFHSVTNY